VFQGGFLQEVMFRTEKTGREGLPGCGKWDKIPLTTRAVALRTKHWIKPKKIGRNEL
jgi:hypothetical protein